MALAPPMMDRTMEEANFIARLLHTPRSRVNTCLGKTVKLLVKDHRYLEDVNES